MPRSDSASALSAGSALAAAVERLASAGAATPRLDAELLLAHVLATDRAGLVRGRDRSLEPDAEDRFEALLVRREAREPVAYILGRRGFRHLDLAVDPRALIPRPETELVVEAALALPPRARVVDVGTGSGAIALALKHERPDLEVWGSDASAEALALAEANANRLGLDVCFLAADLVPPGDWDAVVSNPPYVREDEWDGLAPEITGFEPAQALVAGPDGLAVLRPLIAAAAGVAFLAVEVGAGQAAKVAVLARAAGFAHVEVRPDLAGIERVVVGRR